MQWTRLGRLLFSMHAERANLKYVLFLQMLGSILTYLTMKAQHHSTTQSCKIETKQYHFFWRGVLTLSTETIKKQHPIFWQKVKGKLKSCNNQSMLALRLVKMTRVQELIVYFMACLAKEENLQQLKINRLLIQYRILTFKQIIIVHLRSDKTSVLRNK